MCCTASSAIVVATACGAVLSVLSGEFDGHSFRGKNQHLANSLLDHNAGEVGGVTGDSDGTSGALLTTRGMQELGTEQSSAGDTLVRDRLFQFKSAYYVASVVFLLFIFHPIYIIFAPTSFSLPM